MGILTLVIGILGGLCGAMGIITSFEILEEPIISKFGEIEFFFWFMLAGILLLGSIALSVGYKGNQGE
jgi:hypothetical protein